MSRGCFSIMALALCLAILSAEAITTTREDIVREEGAGTGWTSQRDPGRLKREFTFAEHEWRAQSLQWRFAPKGKTGFNDLFRMRTIERPFSRVIVRLANPGAPFSLCAKVRDDTGAEWVVPRRPLETTQDVVEVVWHWDDWKLAPWASRKEGELLFPLSYFALIAFDISTGNSYHLQVKSVSFESAHCKVTDVSGFDFPQQVRGDTSVTVKPFAVTTNVPLTDVTARLSLQRGQSEFASVPLSAEAEQGSRLQLKPASPLALSWLMRGGEYDIVLHLLGKSGDVPNVMSSLNLGKTQLEMVRGSLEGNHAEVKPHNGVPTLFINGKPHSGMSAAAYHPSPDKFASFTLSDVDLFSFSATPTEGYPGLATLTWKDRDTYDYSQLDQRVAMVLGANRNAYIFPRLYLHAPAWWSKEHPDDVVIAERPNGERYVFMHRGMRPAPSWASEAWRRDTAEGLRRLIKHVETAPYADNFIGYHLASGITEEWMMWGANENEWVDYSPVNQAKFRQWLKNKYGDDETLRRAWNNRSVSLETAEIPSYQRRAAASFGSFRDTTAEMPVIDYYTYHSWLVADTISYFAAVVKDATKRRKTVGVFYGYLLQLGGGQRLHNAGHLALESVLKCPDIDFICSPTSYAFRQQGGLGTTHFMSLVDSVRLHGKLWFDENDVRTSISPGALGSWGKPADIAGDKEQQDKEQACVVTNGVAQWWFDVGANRYDAPELREVVKNLARVGREVQELDRRPNHQAALIVDADSIPYMKVGDRLGSELLVKQLPNLHRAGFPVGHYLASDLSQLQQCRLLVMSMAFAPSEKLRRDLSALKKDGRVIVFLPGSGAYSDGQLAPSAASAFTGIKLGLVQSPLMGEMTFDEKENTCEGLHNVTCGHKGYADGTSLVPVNEGDVTILARFSDRRPAIVMRKYEGWTAVYCAQPQLPARMWRNLARLAKVHSYIDEEDVVYANSSMLSIVATHGGQRMVTLPEPRKVTEMIENKVIAAEPVSSFVMDLKKNQTVILRLDK